MKSIPILLISALLLAAPAASMSANTTLAWHFDEETLSDAVVSRVLHLAAPEFGMDEPQFIAEYNAGQVLIDDLGPIRGGHRYGVRYNSLYIVIDDIMAS